MPIIFVSLLCKLADFVERSKFFYEDEIRLRCQRVLMAMIKTVTSLWNSFTPTTKVVGFYFINKQRFLKVKPEFIRGNK